MLDFILRLEDERIILRPLQKNDLASLLELTTEGDLWKYFTFDLASLESLEEWAQPAWQKERLQFVVIDKKSQAIVGSSALGNYSERDSRIEIGWTWIAEKYQGMGYNQAMKKMMLGYCFETLLVERVEFKTDVLNIAARKALKNINAIEEGVLRSHTLMTKGRRRDTIFYSILKSEWEFVKRENEW